MSVADKHLTNQERIAAIQAVREWSRLDDGFPPPDQHVWVKMDDGHIEIAHWNAARAGWSHSPFQRWGEPAFWAPLIALGQPRTENPPANHLPISGTARSRVRPGQRESHFGFKFLGALFQ